MSVARDEAFPNYTRIAPKVPHGVWTVARRLAVPLLGALAVLLVAAPTTGLDLWWGLLVPALPLLWFVAPGLWRNVCPLAATNQIPRTVGFSRGRSAPVWFREAAPLIGMTAFVVAVASRPVLFDDSGPATAALIAGALAAAFAGGWLLKGKSGWCASICPMLPVQRMYGQAPLVLERNDHCRPCVGCTANCYDFNPRAAHLADLHDPDPHLGTARKLFAGAFPALVIAFFTAPDPQVHGVGEHYARFALAVGAGAGSFFAVEAALRVSAARLAAIYGAAAIILFYWWASEVVVKTVAGSPEPLVVWPLRVAVAALAVAWVRRAWRQEAAFHSTAEEDDGAPAVGLGRNAAAALAAAQNGPEVRFEGHDARIVVRPGATLLEIAERHEQPIESGCRMGVCGADPVAVTAGADCLSALGDDERATLERLGLDPARNRMACCARVQGPVSVSLVPDRTAGAPSGAVEFAFDRAVRRVVVIGNGVAGVTAADHVRRRHPDCEIDVVAAETHPLYNRMGISRLIHGRSAMLGLHLLPEAWYAENGITCWLNTRATGIDREQGEVRLATGEVLPFDRLVLATGSKARVPDIVGWGLPGTFVLRSADDAMALRAHVQRTGGRRAVVAGGGLLGLEAAYALHKLGMRVTVLERGPWLLRRQLDAASAALLRTYLTNLGLDVDLDSETAEAVGDERLEGVRLRDGRELACDVLLAAAGIVPDVDLAVDAELSVGRGVVVDDRLRTSDPRILAVGDVVEWDGGVPGLWPVAVEQAEVAAENVAGGDRAYAGTVPVTMLKVVGVELTSVGRIQPDEASGEHAEVDEDPEALRYRKIVRDAEDLCVGAILLGHPVEAPATVAAVKTHSRLPSASPV